MRVDFVLAPKCNPSKKRQVIHRTYAYCRETYNDMIKEVFSPRSKDIARFDSDESCRAHYLLSCAIYLFCLRPYFFISFIFNLY